MPLASKDFYAIQRFTIIRFSKDFFEWTRSWEVDIYTYFKLALMGYMADMMLVS